MTYPRWKPMRECTPPTVAEIEAWIERIKNEPVKLTPHPPLPMPPSYFRKAQMSVRTKMELVLLLFAIGCGIGWNHAVAQRRELTDEAFQAEAGRARAELELRYRIQQADASRDSALDAAAKAQTESLRATRRAEGAEKGVAHALQAARSAARGDSVIGAALDSLGAAVDTERASWKTALAWSDQRGDELEVALAQEHAARAATDSLYWKERDAREAAQIALAAALQKKPQWGKRAWDVAKAAGAFAAGWKGRCALKACSP